VQQLGGWVWGARASEPLSHSGRSSLAEPAQQLVLPEPVPPEPAHVVEVAAAHGIELLSPATS
jgi:hypothetical protein